MNGCLESLSLKIAITMNEKKTTEEMHPIMPEPTPNASDWISLLRFDAKRRVPVVMQSAGAECGLACIAMVAAYYGGKHDMLALRTKFPTTLRGMRLKEIVNVANIIGLSSRPVKVELADISQLKLPSVLHWNMNHFVVLEKVGRKHLYVVDPARGRSKIPLADADSSFTGVAVEFEPNPSLVKAERKRGISLKALSGGIDGLGRSLLQIFSIAAFLEVLGLLAPQFLQLIIDQVLSANDNHLLTFIGAGFSAILCLKIAAEYLRSWLITWLGASVTIGWTGNVFNHTLRLPLDYFQNRHIGDVVSRFGAVSAIQQTLTTESVVAVVDGIMTAVTAAMLIAYSPRLALISFASAALYSLCRFIYFRTLMENTSNNINVSAIQQGNLIETLRGIQTIRINNRTTERSVKYANSTADVVNTNTRLQRLQIGFNATSGLISGFQRIAVLWLGALLVIAGELSPGMLIAFAAYSDQFTSRFSAMINYLVQFSMLQLHGARLSDIVLTPPEKFIDGDRSLGSGDTSINIDDVSFRYSTDGPPVIEKCTLSIAHGEIVAIVGTSGSGKSTLAKLILGIHDYQSGTISIGGNCIRSLGKRQVREITASILQEDCLFRGTVLDNISLFDPDADLDQCKHAAIMANIDNDIESMPMGYQSLVGDIGSTISGGQQQRLLLARAFYRKPRILILDEATSNLDLDNESKICNAVRAAGLTTIIIAHRPQTIASADRIIRIANGRAHFD